MGEKTIRNQGVIIIMRYILSFYDLGLLCSDVASELEVILVFVQSVSLCRI